jgi:endonuclease/exonuclease/phosphatase family metal-dependent hydrolase
MRSTSDRLRDDLGAVVPALTEVPLAQRLAMRDGPFDVESHRRHFNSVPALSQIEMGGRTNIRPNTDGPIRVVAWNVERLRHFQAIAGTLGTLAPAVALLSEIDSGMARSGNRHPISELAERLGHTYIYGLEFVELDLGNRRERVERAGQTNLYGFHGNAVTSAIEMHRPFLFRLESTGGWYGWRRDEPRVGARMAIGAQIDIAGRLVTVVSVHLESHSDPPERAAQTCRLLDFIERYDSGAPTLIGGDFNTSTLDRNSEQFEMEKRAAATHPQRLIEVAPYEPLFALMADRGFDWRHCNVLGQPTERQDPQRALRPPAKIDWFFTRGLEAAEPAITPALCPDGTPSSDHDCLAVTVAPAG